MKYSQRMIYLCEQLRFLERSIVTQSQEGYAEAFAGRQRVQLHSPEAITAMMYQHFKYYEGPLLARYMIIIQLYSVFERYSVAFSKDISKENRLLGIKDLNGGATFRGIKTFYTKVLDIRFTGWPELDTLRQVRNLIAHCDGYVTHSDQRAKISKLAKIDPDLAVLSDCRLAIREEFIKRSLRAVFRFFDLVEPKATGRGTMLDFSWSHIKEFREFDQSVETEQGA